jgi:dTDP-4-amino-4,6-dideoxygalactose transaminase
MRKIEMVDLKSQYQAMKAEVDAAIQGVIDSTAFIGGKVVQAFADDLARYTGSKHVVPCANGTDALQIALMALGLKPGDEVITSPFTFVATAEVIALLGLKPVFVDIDPGSFNLDVTLLEARLTGKSRCIIPVHLFGQACDMAALMGIARQHSLFVVEDNAQTIGAKVTFPGGSRMMAGNIGDIGTTSFYPTKNLGAYGDGGALFTQDDALAHKLRLICNHGSDRKYYYDSIGVNSRLDAFQAAVLGVKLKRLEAYADARQKAAATYDSRLRGVAGITIPVRVDYSSHVFHQYTIKVTDRRDELKEHLATKGIPTMVYYPVPLHLSSAYMNYGYKEGDFPLSEQVAGEVLSLPMHTELDEEQIDFVCDAIKEFMT